MCEEQFMRLNLWAALLFFGLNYEGYSKQRENLGI